MNATILNRWASQIVDKLPENVQERLGGITTAHAVQVGLGLVVLGQLYRWWKNKVPVYGGILSFSSILSTMRMSIRGPADWLEYYEKYPMAWIPHGDRWHLVVREEFAEEINRAPDSVLSTDSAMEEAIQLTHTLGTEIIENDYQLSVIRNYMTRHLHTIFPDVHDEIKYTFENDPILNSDEWKELPAFDWILQVVAKASNRVLVGVPLCRNPDWLSISLDGAVSVFKTAVFINLFPVQLRNIVGWLVSTKVPQLRRASLLTKGVIEEHMKKEDKTEKADFLDWLLSAAPPEEMNVESITRRIIAVNFAAIHTSSLNLTHALYWITSRPEYVEPMREEIEAVIGEMGWTKHAIGHMPKVESFMKECMRVVPISPSAMNKRVMKPFTFSNGVSPPVGSIVSTHVYATHMNGSIYHDPNTFDGFRFVKPEDDAVARAKETIYSTSPNYMAFSHGRHACPGRFFASMELKIMFAYLVLNYDFSWPSEMTKDLKPGEKYRPKDIWFGAGILPDPKAKILVRKRQAGSSLAETQ
ncbi:Ent-kaurene oxidase; AltName: Full=Cytochrome P450 503A1; AltName: Full=Cytochrome P450-4 [Serendipita indica DSM 11827]|uniref:Probable cycloheximide-inducible protein CIP70 (Cytochrome P450 family) n=1 Tax=Serendipita indica (strain DSM 11827) TaxID=1109443 RepID=G4TM99_SERID|nr:Ent-kaurene oxidase; AltName: Full=Cytochrome P450 503A1; AltName: Full=Cytochrome P450-4 [Serendipita indica DSM 11827]CCA72441.1 probable cycloheximide-inducible protein CIP70 (cytochrome P450 family) [Serendipita indica DSM 11827]